MQSFGHYCARFFSKKAKQADLDRLECAVVELLAAIKNVDKRLREVVDTNDRHADAIDGLGAIMGKDWDDKEGKWRKRDKKLALVSDNRPGVVGADSKTP